jgi:hypothetical protein
MPRYTSLGWWCGLCQQKNSPDSRKCSKCGSNKFQKNAKISHAERAVIYTHPLTGERIVPPRADTPMPQTYVDRGFVRKEITSMSQFEKETGLVHEASNFCPGNEPIPDNTQFPQVSKETKEALVNDMREAIASGPFTGGLDDVTTHVGGVD